MNLSVNWLSTLLGRAVDPQDAAEQLALRCAPVDAVEPLHPELTGVVVGLVESAEPLPDSDHLTLCQVNDGTDVVQVVCGAPNVETGAKYPYARAGTILPNGLKLGRRKIRGVVSNGMLCSERELEFGPDQDGIMRLDTEAEAGTALLEALGLIDTRLELDVTPNRPDLLCHKGVARELGAAYGMPVKLEPVPGAPTASHTARRVDSAGVVGGIDVSIEDVEGCPRYMAAVVNGVTVGPSPAWLQTRLRSVGARPINNVVDATNFVLYELNQPLHAFDHKRLRGGEIIVRRAQTGETLTTLDGASHELTGDMTMICDGSGPTAIGGVMGGADSEVTDETTDIVLECAYFDPKRIRSTRKTLGMTTEASYRFERGTDREAMADALRRGVALIRAVAGGTEPEGAIDVYPHPTKARSVFLRPDRVTHVLGAEIPSGTIERHLSSVGFVVVPKDSRLAVQVPGWRPDVTREVDLIEEVARLEGYESFPTDVRPGRPSAVPDDPIEPLKARLRRVLTALGLSEARSFPMVAEGDDRAQPVLNPMSVDESFLRQDLLPGLMRAVEHNWSVRERDIRLFEIGTVFHRDGNGGRPTETVRLAAVMTGARLPPHWTAGRSAGDYDEWDVKHAFAEGVRVAGPAGTLGPVQRGWTLVGPDAQERGWAGELQADAPPWAAPVFGFELDIEARGTDPVLFQPLPATPPVERDLALILPAGVRAADVEAIVRDTAGPLLEQVGIFDEYRSEEFSGRSVAWRLVFRSEERTLKDREVDRLMQRVLRQLKERIGVERRET